MKPLALVLGFSLSLSTMSQRAIFLKNTKCTVTATLPGHRLSHLKYIKTNP